MRGNINLESMLRLAFQFDILDIEGKDDGADLLVGAVCVFGGIEVEIEVASKIKIKN